MLKKIAILHFRVGRTDGVSLEIANWKVILSRMGFDVKLVGGPISIGADYAIDHLENQLDPEVYLIDEEAFGGFKTIKKDDFEKRFTVRQAALEKEFNLMLKTLNPDFLIVSNIFSVGENLPAAGALTKIIKKLKIKTIAVNHDFWWENERYSEASSDKIQNELERFFPPLMSNLKFACINSIGQSAVSQKKGVKSEILYDSIDFDSLAPQKSLKSWGLLEKSGVNKGDVIVLQATRIVRRKNIEISIDLVARLQKKIKNLVFVMSGYAEKRDEYYEKMLMNYANQIGVKAIKVNGFGNLKDTANDNTCDMMDIYPYASLVTYPSEYEGFGNQFLEAVYMKKPVAVFEYPVFKSDLKPKGFEFISFGDKLIYDQSGLVKIPEETLMKAAKQAEEVLKSGKKYKKMTNKNFKIASKNFSFENTRQVFEKLLSDG